MRSMTGYGTAQVQKDDFRLEIEIKSYNNRYLDIDHTMPFVFNPLQEEIDRRIREVARRGHIDVTVRFTQTRSNVKISVDRDMVARYSEAFSAIAEASGKKLEPSLSDYAAAEGVLTSLQDDEGERYRAALEEVLAPALAQFASAKEREGRATHDNLVELGKKIENGLKVIEKHAGELEALVKKNLEERLDAMLGDKNYDENRIIQEIAINVVRASVNEEVKRLETHLASYFDTLELDEPVGKRLDFLCQEMNREINTIGSKSQIAEMNLEVVKMKDGLEDIREQVRNIE